MSNAFVQRGAAEYAAAIAGELPTGSAWPRDRDGDLMRWVDGCAQIWGDVDGRAADLIFTEADPRKTIEKLADWERAFGLPDACIAEPLTVENRHNALLAKMTTLGGQSRQFFINVAKAIGYRITITEYSPFMFGVSRFGITSPRAPADASDTGQRWVLGPPTIRYYWKVHVFGQRRTWFRFGSARMGVDPMVRIGLATDLECVLRRWKPAHTEVIFDYGNASPSWGEYVWFRFGQSRMGTDPMFKVVQHHGGLTDDVA